MINHERKERAGAALATVAKSAPDRCSRLRFRYSVTGYGSLMPMANSSMVARRIPALSRLPSAQTGQRLHEHGFFLGTEYLTDLLVIFRRGLSDLAEIASSFRGQLKMLHASVTRIGTARQPSLFFERKHGARYLGLVNAGPVRNLARCHGAELTEMRQHPPFGPRYAEILAVDIAKAKADFLRGPIEAIGKEAGKIELGRVVAHYPEIAFDSYKSNYYKFNSYNFQTRSL